MTQYSSIIHSPLGILELIYSDEAISGLGFINEEEKSLELNSIHPLFIETQTQLKSYFEGKLKQFDLPLKPNGTDFQKRVWNELLTIPFGETNTYLGMAKQLGDEKVIRAAGSANGKNPIGIIIPCHRVIGSDGSLVGYAGGLWRKKWLLELEAKYSGKPIQGSLF